MLRRAALLRMNSSVRGMAGTSSGDKLLGYWQDVLTPEGHSRLSTGPSATDPQSYTEADVKRLMQTALRVRQGRVPGVLPEQMAGMLISFYKNLRTADGRASFFETLTRDLGIDGARESH